MIGLLGLWFIPVGYALKIAAVAIGSAIVGATVEACTSQDVGGGDDVRGNGDHDGSGGDRFDSGNGDRGGITDAADRYVPPPDDGGDKPEIDGGRDGGDSPDADDGGDDGDAGERPDGSGDGGVTPPRRGMNLAAATFDGNIADIDPVEDGLIVYAGTPPKVWRCQVNGIENAACRLVAQSPADVYPPVNYLSLGDGRGLAVASPAEGNPFDVLFIDERNPDPVLAVVQRRRIRRVWRPSPEGGWSISPTYPLGLASYQSPRPGRVRAFIAMNDWLSHEDRFVSGTILCFGMGSGYPLEDVGLPQGYGTSALATASLNFGDGEKTYLLALNSGIEGQPANIAIMDPEPRDIEHIDAIPLGNDVRAVSLPELALSESELMAYVGVVSPWNRLFIIDLVSKAIQSVDLCCGQVLGRISGIEPGVGKVYVADDRPAGDDAVVVVDPALRNVTEWFAVPDGINSMAARGNFLYAGIGGALVAIDPSQVELRQ